MQFGFMPGKGTTDVIFIMQKLKRAEVGVSGSETVLVCGWKQVVVDGGKLESLHNFHCWTEEQDRSIRSAERGVLAWFRDCDDFQIDGIMFFVT